jgi:hypothetical protein
MLVFSKPLTTFKLKEEFQALARALDISTLGTKDEILTRIKQHLADHPELAQNTRFKGLFLQSNRRNQATPNVNITMPIASTSSQPINEAEVHTSCNMKPYSDSINHLGYSTLPQFHTAGNYPTSYYQPYSYSASVPSSSNNTTTLYTNPHLQYSSSHSTNSAYYPSS